MRAYHRPQRRCRIVPQSAVAQGYHTSSSPEKSAPKDTAWPNPLGCALPCEKQARPILVEGQVGQHPFIAGLLQRRHKLRIDVQVILDSTLLPTGNDQDLAQTAACNSSTTY